MESEQGNTEQAVSPEVWLVRETDPLRANQHLVAIYRGGQATFFEHEGVAPPKAVDAALALAGFQGGGAPQMSVKVVRSADVHVEKLRGFEVGEPKIGVVEMAIRMVLGGFAGGFSPLHLAQVGYGCSVTAQIAFDRAWDAAGRPALLVRTGTFPSDAGGQLLDIHASALVSPSMLAARFRHDDGLTDDSGAPVKSGAQKTQALGANVIDRVVPESKPCPFCGRPMVRRDGAYYCVQTLAEQAAASAPRQ